MQDLTQVAAVSAPDSVENDEWSFIGDGGEAHTPSISIVSSPFTSSGFSSYAGSPAGGPGDIGFAHPGMEQVAMTASTVTTAAPGNTMHDDMAAMAAMAATGHHGAAEVTPDPFPMLANEMAALQYAYCETLGQMQFDMDQIQDMTTCAVPDPSAIMMPLNETPSLGA